MNLFRPVAVLLFFIAVLPAVWGVSYDVLVQESGSSVVIASVQGSGLHTLELPMDAEPVVRGALYLEEDNLLTLSVGSTESAAVIYQTDEFVSSVEGKEHRISINLDGPARLILPKSFKITSANPSVFIEQTGVQTLYFDGHIELVYSADTVGKGDKIFVYSFFAAFAVLAGFVVFRQISCRRLS